MDFNRLIISTFAIGCTLFQNIFFSEIQQRIPNEVLSGLATAIASGHIYEIVKGLTEVQQLEEKSLFHQRLELLKKHSGK